MLTFALCLVPLAAAAIWVFLQAGESPASLADLAGFAVVLTLHLLESRIVHRLWAGTMSSARPLRLALALAGLAISFTTFLRVCEAWPFALDDWKSWAGIVWMVETLLADEIVFLLYLAVAAAAGTGVAHGVCVSLGQASQLIFDAMGGASRRRAKSDLHGTANFMTRHEIRKLGNRRSANNIILGAEPGMFGSRLVTYELRGSVTTLAPPRTGKTVLIILNLLDPGRIGWHGSTVTMDPRGNIYAVTAKARAARGRKVRLVDPFGIVQRHRERHGTAVVLPEIDPVTLNPLDLIRLDSNHSSDIQALLRVILDNPGGAGNSTAEHFYNLCLNVLTGMISWVSHNNGPETRTLAAAHRLCAMSGPQLEALRAVVDASDSPGRPFTDLGLEALARVGTSDEGASVFTSMLNQLAFVYNEQIGANIRRSSFDPMSLADGNTDLYVVVPQEHFAVAAPWIRMWMALPAIVANRVSLKRHVLIYLDEMPTLGYIDPVMKSFNMAAGQGVHYWCIAQTPSALDKSYGETNRRIIMENAEVLQAIGFSAYTPGFAEEFAKAVGHATFHNRSETRSGGHSDRPTVSGGAQNRASLSDGLVRESIIAADDLMRLPADEQIVITATRRVRRNAMRLNHARYWHRRDCRGLFSPDPLELGNRAS